MKRYVTAFLLVCVALNAADCRRDDTKNIVICNNKRFGKLMWQDNEQRDKVVWNTAMLTCDMLRLGGYSDWRLPSVDEFGSIAGNSAFKYTNSGLYWSSTRFDSVRAFVIDPNTGGSDYLYGVKTLSYSVRCVR